MDRYRHDLILQRANEVRAWAEDQRPEGDNLTGMCALASAKLHELLEQDGIAAELHVWNCRYTQSAHVYVVVDDHVLDVTATQFYRLRDRPIVYIHTREAIVYDFYNTVESFASVYELHKHQKKNKWPMEQTVPVAPRKVIKKKVDRVAATATM